MVKNKRGWIRMLEATIAVMIVGSVLIMVYATQPQQADYSEEITNLQKQILMDISSEKNLRLNVLYSEFGDNYTDLTSFVKGKIPNHLDFSVVVCNLTIPVTPCKLNSTLAIEVAEKDVFVDETIISTEIGAQDPDPKKVRLFIWEK